MARQIGGWLSGSTSGKRLHGNFFARKSRVLFYDLHSIICILYSTFSIRILCLLLVLVPRRPRFRGCLLRSALFCSGQLDTAADSEGINAHVNSIFHHNSETHQTIITGTKYSSIHQQ